MLCRMYARQSPEGTRRAAVIGSRTVEFPAHQGVLHIFLELEVLRAGLGLLVGFAAAAIGLVQRIMLRQVSNASSRALIFVSRSR